MHGQRLSFPRERRRAWTGRRCRAPECRGNRHTTPNAHRARPQAEPEQDPGRRQNRSGSARAGAHACSASWSTSTGLEQGSRTEFQHHESWSDCQGRARRVPRARLLCTGNGGAGMGNATHRFLYGFPSAYRSRRSSIAAARADLPCRRASSPAWRAAITA